MNEEEYDRKFTNLRILKSIQEYLKSKDEASTAVYPIKVPDDLLYQVLKTQGAENADKLIHRIFEMCLTIWSEQLYHEAFGSKEKLENFIELVKGKSLKEKEKEQ